MTGLVAFLQNATAVAFGALGIATTIVWIRRKDRSLAYLALAIVLLSAVSVLGRVPALLGFSPPLLAQVSLLGFMASAYALLRYRASLIPIPRGWHATVVAAMVAASVLYLAAQALAAAGTVPASVMTAFAFVLIGIWAAVVVEPIVRFWLVSNRLHAVQRWRLRSLSMGFAGLVLILLFAIGASIATRSTGSPGVQVAIEVVVLAIVPLLYASFAPPSWLRREWRAVEEENLRRFMEQLLLAGEHEKLADEALAWTLRLTGGAAALAVDSEGGTLAARGLDRQGELALKSKLPAGFQGVVRVSLPHGDATVLVMPISVLGASGQLAVVSGPFTPGFGGDEINRIQQFMSAVTTALDRQRVIQRLKETNVRLDKANRYKSTFLANMSHELRTPLNAIIGFSELLIDASEDQYDAVTRRRFLTQIHTSGKHLLGLINDILDLSKVEAGQMELRLENTAVSEVIDQVMHTIEPLAKQKRISIDWGAAGDRKMLVDPGKLKQMLLNLVSNAIKFTPEGGRVHVRTAWGEDSVKIAITDSGIGIAEKDQVRIFEEFQQVDSGAGRAQQGTGLGLALTRRFAHLHGGEVTVVSELGEGSTFTLTLPARATRPEVAAPQTGPIVEMPRVSGPLVLVVEDNVSAAELISHSLARGGFQTTVATNGRDALAKAQELRPLAITLDVMLPELDGWEVLSRLKRDPATAEIPVVIVSVIDNPELGTALGALDYFVKPVDAGGLVRCLSRYNFRRQNGQDDCSVLVVDDERANRDLLKEILEPAGFSVVLAEGGSQALREVEKAVPDLVLLDLMMPGVNGFDVVERLRADASTRAIPIIVLTAKDLTEADKSQLSGRVSRILARRSTGAADLLSQLQEVLVHRGVPA